MTLQPENGFVVFFYLCFFICGGVGVFAGWSAFFVVEERGFCVVDSWRLVYLRWFLETTLLEVENFPRF
jgi:hypothetical protein